MTEKVRFIGDIHGDYSPYEKIVKDAQKSVQIGDFGIGFHPASASTVDSFFDYVERDGGSHRFIRGNHDDPGECKKCAHWIADGTVEGDIMYVGGAKSIDKDQRTPGLSWWPDEELSIPELEDVIAKYEKARPRILVTHECPEFFAREAMIPLVRGVENFRSQTRDALDIMYAIKPPEIHIFGHWHRGVDYVEKRTGTRFICLGIMQYLDLEV